MKFSLRRNVGTVDKLVRLPLVAVLLYLGFVDEQLISSTTLRYALIFLGFMNVFAVTTGHCPFYVVADVNTNTAPATRHASVAHIKRLLIAYNMMAILGMALVGVFLYNSANRYMQLHDQQLTAQLLSQVADTRAALSLPADYYSFALTADGTAVPRPGADGPQQLPGELVRAVHEGPQQTGSFTLSDDGDYTWAALPVGADTSVLLIHRIAPHTVWEFAKLFAVPLGAATFVILWLSTWAAVAVGRLLEKLDLQKVELENRQAELEKAHDAAQDASRAKSAFLASMSHELRTPLNAIIGYSELLEEEAKDDGLTTVVRDLKRIHHAGQHLLSLVNDVLDLSKVEAGKMELHLDWVNLEDLIASVEATLRPLAERNRNRLSLQVQLEPRPLFLDETKLRQLLFNLLSNALKFTQDGEVRLQVDLDNQQEQRWLRVRVSDTGIGMSRNQLEKIFQPFVQADAQTGVKYGGTGLGLAICKRFVELMQGEVSVTSEPGKGSVFTLRIPAGTPEEHPAESTSGASLAQQVSA